MITIVELAEGTHKASLVFQLADPLLILGVCWPSGSPPEPYQPLWYYHRGKLPQCAGNNIHGNTSTGITVYRSFCLLN